VADAEASAAAAPGDGASGMTEEQRDHAVQAFLRSGRGESRLSLLFRVAMAARLGITASDMECLDFLMERGSATAGELAQTWRPLPFAKRTASTPPHSCLPARGDRRQGDQAGPCRVRAARASSRLGRAWRSTRAPDEGSRATGAPGEETYQLMLAIAAAPGADLEAVEPRWQSGSPSGRTSVSKIPELQRHMRFPHGREIRENICSQDVLRRRPPIRSSQISGLHLASRSPADGAP
jgi:hypothetical protein